MKKILEYRAFEILKDEKNQDFLKKVKLENPELYSNFVNIIGKKGLEIAKKEYEPYDPEYKKILKEREKKEDAERKRQKSKEYKEEKKKEFFKKIEPQINEVENILLDSELYEVENFLKTDKNISLYLKSFKAKKHYMNNFTRYVNQNKNLTQLEYELFHRDINIDILYFDTIISNRYGDSKYKHTIIVIRQYYNIQTKEFKYLISLTIPTLKPKIDDNKSYDFLNYRNKYIHNLSNIVNLTGIKADKTELYDIISKFSEALSEDFYQNWQIEQEMKKFNV